MFTHHYPQEAEIAVSEPIPAPTPAERIRERVRRSRANIQRTLLFLAGVAAAFAAVLMYQSVTPGPHLLTTGEVNDAIARAFASVTPMPAFSEGVYRVIQPSLVLVQANSQGTDGAPRQSIGSAVIISAQGDILTSLHVVTASTGIQLTFADGTQSSAQIIATQPENDIAVLHADQPPTQIIPATLGNPGAISVGDEAFAVGNPFGLYGSMSSGVISGIGRAIQPVGSAYELKDLIQIDAAVNPGNSGGPLLNRNGEVIGIITGLVNPTDQNFFVGIGFAVPINIASQAAGAPQY